MTDQPDFEPGSFCRDDDLDEFCRLLTLEAGITASPHARSLLRGARDKLNELDRTAMRLATELTRASREVERLGRALEAAKAAKAEHRRRSQGGPV